jgi:O-6-methylguanine DNA methyltransferase
MQKITKYAIFQTKWGYFGLAGSEYGLFRTQLPGSNPEKIKTILLKNLPTAQSDKNFYKNLQQQITAYFDGDYVTFSRNIPLILNGFTQLGKSVLKNCRKIEIGQTITYGQLAKKAGRPKASRAVGSTLAKNPLPLIIPCHRVLRCDGKLGGFSATGGISFKKKLLELEQKAIGI